ncbi:4Fe-4S dicluster domain-containing protein [Desulfohalobium retbaense]|uniref:Heterodisulfide reductase subunit C n=1 Tax=Desulfohalobium retbaense (strain ATCC 49708 / DSM 5692 / JCM 16813 / HR100) TaxID=485915 RepID=C8X5A4_DESRD|nr:4Fe-4S dicluster domain-containing protein [Desulfohalobium retbaense]ACV69601.1 heterodisulfide reductase subunit C [Desulfohalobium retbaense DSM 5692]
MQTINLSTHTDPAFTQQVNEESHQDVALCYQCGNCTAGCPYTFVYDIPVHQIMRLVQAGQKDTVLRSRSLWLCATCQSCTTRCPNNIDVAQVMDVLRHMARREGYVTERNVKLFYDAFLESVHKHGRVYELGAMSSYIAHSKRVMTDAELGPTVMAKGKLSFTPHNIEGKEHVAAIFDRYMEKQEQGREAYRPFQAERMSPVAAWLRRLRREE